MGCGELGDCGRSLLVEGKAGLMGVKQRRKLEREHRQTRQGRCFRLSEVGRYEKV